MTWKTGSDTRAAAKASELLALTLGGLFSWLLKHFFFSTWKIQVEHIMQRLLNHAWISSPQFCLFTFDIFITYVYLFTMIESTGYECLLFSSFLW